MKIFAASSNQTLSHPSKIPSWWVSFLIHTFDYASSAQTEKMGSLTLRCRPVGVEKVERLVSTDGEKVAKRDCLFGTHRPFVPDSQVHLLLLFLLVIPRQSYIRELYRRYLPTGSFGESYVF